MVRMIKFTCFSIPGLTIYEVEFRLVVFRPFKGEILQGVILESSSPDGIRGGCEVLILKNQHLNTDAYNTVGLDFFADVWIPGPTNMPEGSRL